MAPGLEEHNALLGPGPLVFYGYEPAEVFGTKGVTARVARSRARVDSFPNNSMDSNSGGDTACPEMPTRRAP